MKCTKAKIFLPITIKELITSIEKKAIAVSNVEKRAELDCEFAILEAKLDFRRAKKRVLRILCPFFRAKALLGIALEARKQGKLSQFSRTLRKSRLIAINIKDEFLSALLGLEFLRLALEEKKN